MNTGSRERYGETEASGEEAAGGACKLTLQLDHEAKMLADQARHTHTHTHTHTHVRVSESGHT